MSCERDFITKRIPDDKLVYVVGIGCSSAKSLHRLR